MIFFSEEEIRSAYRDSSPVIQEIVSSSWVTDEMIKIGEELKIRVDKVDLIITLIGYVILNLISIKKLLDYIISDVEIDRKKAEEIVKKIDENIFSEIRNRLREESLKKKEKEREEMLSKKVETEEYIDKKNSEEEKKIDPYLEPID